MSELTGRAKMAIAIHTWKPWTRGAPPTCDYEKICDGLRAGIGLAELAQIHGVSRQRIHQIGVKQGVWELYRIARAAAKPPTYAQRDEANRRERIMWQKGMTPEALAELRRIGATLAYRSQKRNADERGIEWQFNLADWWAIWLDSGKFALRGRKIGQYVMARHGDVGPYAEWNVKIITCSENSKEARRLQKKLVADPNIA